MFPFAYEILFLVSQRIPGCGWWLLGEESYVPFLPLACWLSIIQTEVKEASIAYCN